MIILQLFVSFLWIRWLGWCCRSSSLPRVCFFHFFCSEIFPSFNQKFECFRFKVQQKSHIWKTKKTISKMNREEYRFWSKDRKRSLKTNKIRIEKPKDKARAKRVFSDDWVRFSLLFFPFVASNCCSLSVLFLYLGIVAIKLWQLWCHREGP